MTGAKSAAAGEHEIASTYDEGSYLWFVKAIHDRPLRWCFICLGAIFCIVAIVIVSGAGDMSEESDQDWLLRDKETSIYADAVDQAKSGVDAKGGTAASAVVLKERSVKSSLNSLILMVENPNGVIKPAVLQELCELERVMMGDDEFKNFCTLDLGSNATCADPSMAWPFYRGGINLDAPNSNSLVSIYYEPPAFARSPYYNNTRNGHATRKCELLSQAHLDHVSAALVFNPTYKGVVGVYLGKNTVPGEPLQTPIARSFLYAGTPLKGFSEESKDVIAREGSQQMLYKTWWLKLEKKFFAHFHMETPDLWAPSPYRANDGKMPLNKDSSTTAYFFVSFIQQGIEMKRMVDVDFYFAFGSILFVWTYISVHTRSVLLGSLGMLHIILSLFMALFFTRVLFQIDFFSQLHILVVYLVLGIGADDVFVITDAWKQSESMLKVTKSDGTPCSARERELARLDYTYRRAGTAMLETSSTTVVAFFATAMSPIMPISSFGWFAMMCIVSNYIFVMTFYPTVLVLHNRGVCCCCCAKSPYQLELVQQEGAATPVAAVPAVDAVEEGGAANAPADGVAAAAAGSKETESKAAEPGFAEKFAHVVVKPQVRFPLIAVFTTLGIVGIIGSSKLEPPTEVEQWFPDDHANQIVMNKMSTDFQGGAEDSYINAELTWGLRGMDRDGTSRWKPAERGSLIYDEGFDMSSSAAQQFFLDTCRAVETEKCDLPGCQGGTGTMARPNSVNCWARHFNAWGGGSACAAALRANPAATPPSSCQEGAAQAMNWTLAETVQVQAAQFALEIKSYREIFFANTSAVVGVSGGKLKYTVLPFRSTLIVMQPNPIAIPFIEKAQAFAKSRASAAPAGMRLIGVTSQPGIWWSWPQTELALVNGVFIGFAICFPSAFVVLLLATRSFTLAVSAILTIIGIVSTVLGFCQIVMQWGLGTAESIAAVIIIGFSVDYCVHLAHMYVDAHNPVASNGLTVRQLRTISAIKTMGGTVVGGAVTTAGSGLFLFFCQVTFFFKFGLLLFVTILSSLAWTLLFFCPLMATLGPEQTPKTLQQLFTKSTGTSRP